MPPRWTWPRTTARVSNPVRCSISTSSRCPIPPRRTWPNSSVLAAGHLHRPLLRQRALGDDDDREEAPARVAAPDQLADLVDVERPLGDQDHVAAAGDPRVERDPAGVAAHHLDHHHPVVGLGRRVQAVDRLGRDLQRGVEAEGDVGGADVVVDRLRHPEHVDAVLGVQAVRRARGCPRRRSRSGRRARGRSKVSRDPLAAPSSRLNGFVREVPRIVPPRGRIPRVDSIVSSSASPSSGPRQPSRKPTISSPCRSMPLRTTARITALRPGQSPPPVSTPNRIRPTYPPDRRAAGPAAASAAAISPAARGGGGEEGERCGRRVAAATRSA